LVAAFLIYLLDLLKLWIHTLFISPFVNLTMLWILVPIWLGWFFAEFFQEKTGTSIGNAMSNATIIIWASIDCTRQTVSLIGSGDVTGFLNIFARFAIIGLLFSYGLLVVILGIKGNLLVRKIGRIREVTYVFAMFIPVLYNFAPLTLGHVIATIIFFPVFYFALEIIDHIVPDPKAIIADNGLNAGQDVGLGAMGNLGGNNLGNNIGRMPNMNNLGNLDDRTGRFGRMGGFQP
jgi:hypothetical protein